MWIPGVHYCPIWSTYSFEQEEIFFWPKQTQSPTMARTREDRRRLFFFFFFFFQQIGMYLFLLGTYKMDHRYISSTLFLYFDALWYDWLSPWQPISSGYFFIHLNLSVVQPSWEAMKGAATPCIFPSLWYGICYVGTTSVCFVAFSIYNNFCRSFIKNLNNSFIYFWISKNECMNRNSKTVRWTLICTYK